MRWAPGRSRQRCRGNRLAGGMSELTDRFSPVSCITLTAGQRRLLATLTGGPCRVEQLDDRDQLVELWSWGWVFGREWIELTGAGHYHAGTAVGGLVGRA